MRAVVTHLAPVYSLTAVIDTTQRIYPRYLSWAEAGVPPFRRVHTLHTNYRNTVEIANFARSLVAGLNLDEDAAVPAGDRAERHGAMPTVVVGKYRDQVKFALERLSDIDLTKSTVAIMTMWGGASLNFTRQSLNQAGVDFVDLQARKQWPQATANVAVTTLYSAKGLEFDHVFILGLNGEMTRHDSEEDDATLDRLRRLVAMAVGRARVSVTIGYKAEDPSSLVAYFLPGSFREVRL